MKRTKNIKPTAILGADFHIREDIPISRDADFLDEQWKALEFVNELQLKYDCPVFHAGDLFHHWKPSPHLLSQTIMTLPNEFYSVAGQHDLPQHNMELIHKSGIFTLAKANKLQILPECSWGQDPNKGSFFIPGHDLNVLVWHKFVWDGKELPWPDCKESTAKQLLKKYPQFDLIVTGDHHKPFTHELDGRLLVNPGCLTRQTADFIDHRPRVYLWYAETNKIVPVYTPTIGTVSRTHIEKQEKKDERINAFISKLDTDWKLTLDFAQNLKQFFDQNPDTSQDVKDIIYEIID